MALHLAEVHMAFGDMPKGLRFDYDPEVDERINKLIEIGLIVDLGEDEREEANTESADAPKAANPGRVRADKAKSEDAAAE